MSTRRRKNIRSEKDTRVIIQDGKLKWPVVIAGDAHSAERHAAEDLCAYIGAATGANVPLVTDGGTIRGPALRIGRTAMPENPGHRDGDALKGLGEDAYAVQITPAGINLFGNRPRATAYAVYDFLNQLGFRFFEPTDYGEVIPAIQNRQVVIGTRIEKPDKPFREIDLDLSFWDGVDWEKRIIQWALKNRLNVVGISPFHAIQRSRLIHCFPELMREIKRLDLDACVGGHGIAWFLALPEKYANVGILPGDEQAFFDAVKENQAERPYFYGLKGNDPTPREQTTFYKPFPCLSQPAVMDQMIKTALAFLERFPEIDILRLACNDASLGCECEQCRSKETLQRTTHGFAQQMELVRRLAEAIHGRFPGKRLAHTLQGNASLDYDRQVRHYDLPPNVILWYGLENESYVDPLAGKAGDGQAGFGHRDLIARVERFSEACGGRDVVIKEMHGSGLYWLAACAAPHVIAANQVYFRHVSPHFIGGHIFVNPSQHWPLWTLNFLAHFGCLWNPHFDVDAMIGDYAEKYFGPAAGIMTRVITATEKHGTLIGLAINRASYGSNDSEPPYGDWLNILTKAHKALASLSDGIREILYSPIPAEYRCRLRDQYASIEYTSGMARVLIPHLKGIRCLAQAEVAAGPDQAVQLRRQADEFSRLAQAEWTAVGGKYSVRRANDCLAEQACPFSVKKSYRAFR